jgi:hypothetical protein
VSISINLIMILNQLLTELIRTNGEQRVILFAFITIIILLDLLKITFRAQVKSMHIK